MGVPSGDIVNCNRKLYIREGLYNTIRERFLVNYKKLPIREHFLSRIIPVIRYLFEI